MKNFRLSNIALATLLSSFILLGCQEENEAILPSTVEDNLAIADVTTDLTPQSGCSAELTITRSIRLGNYPKLRPSGHGRADVNDNQDCDYFVAFPNNSYGFLYVYDADDAYAASQIRKLITDPAITAYSGGPVIGGGFGGALARAVNAKNYFDYRTFIIFGNGRTEARLSWLASARNTTISALLAKHLRMSL